MNPPNLSARNSACSQASLPLASPWSSSNYISELLEEPMIKTPKKERIFDPIELMRSNLVKTPEQPKHRRHYAFSSMPGKPGAKLVKEQRQLSNFTIHRGQCSVMDCKTQGYLLILQRCLEFEAATEASECFELEGNSSPSKKQIRMDYKPSANLISRAEKFLKESI